MADSAQRDMLLLILSMCPGVAPEDGAEQLTDILINAATPVPIGIGQVAAQGLHVRKGPGTNFPITTTISKGDLLRIWRHLSTGWSFVSERGGREFAGWVASRLISQG